VDDLLHGPAGADAEGFQFNLDDGDAVDEQDDVVAVVAVVGVDAELADDLEGVLAPVLDVDKRVVQRRAVIASKAITLAKHAGSSKNVRRDDFFQKALEFAVGQRDAVERLELLAEVFLQRSTIADVFAAFVLQATEFFEKFFFELAFGCSHYVQVSRCYFGFLAALFVNCLRGAISLAKLAWREYWRKMKKRVPMAAKTTTKTTARMFNLRRRRIPSRNFCCRFDLPQVRLSRSRIINSLYENSMYVS